MAALNRPTARWRNESGAELIEFALTFPLLLLVALGIVDFGFLLQRYEVVTNAAREGARIAVLPDYGPADVDYRVRQYLLAGGLTDMPTIPAPAIEVLVLPGGQCVSVTRVTVQYPHPYSFVGGIATYFGASFSSRMVQATAAMRNELPEGCP